MTNVPFINKITNELSKRKLKSDVVANAILDIAVGNDRLDNLIANGVTHSDLESLTLGGLTTEQTAAIEKIAGINSSASEIDNSVRVVINVLDFVADPLSTDFRLPFQNCLTYLGLIGGGTMFIPNGLYVMKSKTGSGVTKEILNVPSNINIWGQSWNAIVKVGDNISADSPLFFSSKFNKNIHYSNFQIDGNKQRLDSPSEGESEGINFKSVTHGSISNMYIHDTGQEGIDLDDCQDILIQHSVIKDTYGNAIHMGGANFNSDITVRDCIIENVSYGRQAVGLTAVGAITSSGHRILIENTYIKNAYRGINISRGTTNPNPKGGVTLRNVVIEDFESNAIFANPNSVNIKIENTYIFGTERQTASTTVDLNSVGVKGVNIDGLVIENNYIGWVITCKAPNAKLKNISITNASTALNVNGANSSVSSSTFTNCAKAISLNEDACIVTECRTASTPIAIVSNKNKHIVKNNYLKGTFAGLGADSIVSDNIVVV